MEFNKLMNQALKNFKESTIPGMSTTGTLDKSCHFYHITSHSFNDENIYNFETATYRHNLLCNMARSHGCILLLDATKPTHSHELLMCCNFEDAATVIRSVNSHVAKIIKSSKEKKYSIKGMRVFRERPAYQGVKTYVHLLYLVKYFWENCKQTTDKGKPMPYSCFAQIEKGFTKDYNMELLNDIFTVPFAEIIKKCKETTAEEFYSYCTNLYSNVDKEKEKLFFLRS